MPVQHSIDIFNVESVPQKHARECPSLWRAKKLLWWRRRSPPTMYPHTHTHINKGYVKRITMLTVCIYHFRLCSKLFLPDEYHAYVYESQPSLYTIGWGYRLFHLVTASICDNIVFVLLSSIFLSFVFAFGTYLKHEKSWKDCEKKKLGKMYKITCSSVDTFEMSASNDIMCLCKYVWISSAQYCNANVRNNSNRKIDGL